MDRRDHMNRLLWRKTTMDPKSDLGASTMSRLAAELANGDLELQECTAELLMGQGPHGGRVIAGHSPVSNAPKSPCDLRPPGANVPGTCCPHC